MPYWQLPGTGPEDGESMPRRKRPDARQVSSKYPVKAGYVLLLNHPRVRFNDKIGFRAPHRVFIWILRVFKRRLGKRLQDCKVRVCFHLIPMDPTKIRQWLFWDRDVSFRYLTKLLSNGYKEVDTKSRWHYRRKSARRYCRVIENHLGGQLVKRID